MNLFYVIGVNLGVFVKHPNDLDEYVKELNLAYENKDKTKFFKYYSLIKIIIGSMKFKLTKNQDV